MYGVCGSEEYILYLWSGWLCVRKAKRNGKSTHFEQQKPFPHLWFTSNCFVNQSRIFVVLAGHFFSTKSVSQLVLYRILRPQTSSCPGLFVDWPIFTEYSFPIGSKSRNYTNLVSDQRFRCEITIRSQSEVSGTFQKQSWEIFFLPIPIRNPMGLFHSKQWHEEGKAGRFPNS